VLSSRTPYPIYYNENPIGLSWRGTNTILADALNIPNLIPFKELVQRVRAVPQRNNLASILAQFQILPENVMWRACTGYKECC
jgi:hypothetical protein